MEYGWILGGYVRAFGGCLSTDNCSSIHVQELLPGVSLGSQEFRNMLQSSELHSSILQSSGIAVERAAAASSDVEDTFHLSPTARRSTSPCRVVSRTRISLHRWRDVVNYFLEQERYRDALAYTVDQAVRHQRTESNQLLPFFAKMTTTTNGIDEGLASAFRQHLPDLTSPRFTTSAQQSPYEYSEAFQKTGHPPWLYKLTKAWEQLLEEPFQGVTADGRRPASD